MHLNPWSAIAGTLIMYALATIFWMGLGPNGEAMMYKARRFTAKQDEWFRRIFGIKKPIYLNEKYRKPIYLFLAILFSIWGTVFLGLFIFSLSK